MNKAPTDTEKQIQTVKELREYDHALLSVEAAKKLAKPFGLNPSTYVVEANPYDFKGLTLNNGAKSVKGVPAHYLAKEICHHMGVKFESKMGIGSQLRECCDALEKSLN